MQLARPTTNAILAEYPSAERLLGSAVPHRRLLRGRHAPYGDARSLSTMGYLIPTATPSAFKRNQTCNGSSAAPGRRSEDARLPSAEGRSEPAATDYMGFRMRSKFSRDMFHPALPDAAWNAFTVGDCDSAALMKKAFDPDDGPLRDKATPYTTSKTA